MIPARYGNARSGCDRGFCQEASSLVPIRHCHFTSTRAGPAVREEEEEGGARDLHTTRVLL